MSFLRQLPQDWRSRELRGLRDLLVVAYPGVEPLRQIAAQAGLAPGTFPIADDMRTVCTELVRIAGNQGLLTLLVEEASVDPTTAGFHDQFQAMLADSYSAAVTAPAPTDDGLDTDALGVLQLQRLMQKRSRLIGIELARLVTEAAPSVARLTIRFDSGQRGAATGFLIAPTHLLTSNHNLQHKTYGQASMLTADFDYDGIPRTGTRMLRRLLLPAVISDPLADWAVLMLDDPVPRVPLILGSRFTPNLDDLLVIIQHPVGAPKQFAIEPLAVTYASSTALRYLADTQQGSSGSPVCNESMEVIAVHRGEREVMVDAGGQRQVVWYNEGSPIDPILDRLSSHGVPYTSGVRRDQRAT